MTFYAIATCRTLSEMKLEYPTTSYILALMGIDYPSNESFRFYNFDWDSTATPDDDEVIKPSYAAFDTIGRWLKVDFDIDPQVNADWTASSGPSRILNKPALAAVATSGNYNDLSGKPALAAVATSGSYNDLSNKPSIPSAYTFSVGAPNTISPSLGTAYQASTPSKAAEVTINLTSTAALTLGGGSVFEADIVIGASAAVASGTGTVIGKYKNSLTGSLVVGVAINNAQTTMHKFTLPAGWYFAIRQITGTGISVVSAFDQTLG